MTYYVTDWDRLGGQFYDTYEEAAKKADELALKFKGNKVYVYNLIQSKAFFHEVDPHLAALKKAEAVLSKVFNDYVMSSTDRDETKEALNAVRDAKAMLKHSESKK
jgi:hypothetical protein